MVRGIYEDIWTTFIGEIHHMQQEADNAEDCFAVAIQVQLKVRYKFPSDFQLV